MSVKSIEFSISFDTALNALRFRSSMTKKRQNRIREKNPHKYNQTIVATQCMATRSLVAWRKKKKLQMPFHSVREKILLPISLYFIPLSFSFGVSHLVSFIWECSGHLFTSIHFLVLASKVWYINTRCLLKQTIAAKNLSILHFAKKLNVKSRAHRRNCHLQVFLKYTHTSHQWHIFDPSLATQHT